MPVNFSRGSKTELGLLTGLEKVVPVYIVTFPVGSILFVGNRMDDHNFRLGSKVAEQGGHLCQMIMDFTVVDDRIHCEDKRRMDLLKAREGLGR